MYSRQMLQLINKTVRISTSVNGLRLANIIDPAVLFKELEELSDQDDENVCKISQAQP